MKVGRTCQNSAAADLCPLEGPVLTTGAFVAFTVGWEGSFPAVTTAPAGSWPSTQRLPAGAKD